MFLEMVATDTMLVQVTLTSEAPGVWVEKGGQGFTVRELQGGDSNATFDWQVSAIRKGYEGARLEERDEVGPAASENDPPGETPEELVTPVEPAAPAQND
jgi:hypothetical protein